MTSLSAHIYAKLPVIIQNYVVSIYGIYWRWLRFGGNYSTFESDYLSRDRFNATQWNEHQKHALTKLLKICMNQVPYYAREWTKEQKSSARIGELSGLPLLEKNPIRINPLDFVRVDHKPIFRVTNYTSGSTGTPLATIWTPSEIRDTLAVREVRSARWAGVSFKLPRATFSGRMVEPNPDSKGPYYRFNSIERQVYFSPFHLRPDSAHFYVDALRKHNIQWMTGYAVSYYLLAKYILKNGLEVPPLKAVITTSEKLTREMRTVMENAFHCRIFEEYSTVENALFASECEHGHLHVSPDVGIVEILRPDGSPCDPGEVGEVITTSFRTYQPFIRYRIGDLATWDTEPCPCGRSMPVLKEVVGRMEDVVTGPDGRQLVRFHGIFVDQPHVIEGQIIQDNLRDFIVKVVPSENFTETDVTDIKKRMHQRLGPNVNVTVETVPQIPRTKSGKFKAVISKV